MKKYVVCLMSIIAVSTMANAQTTKTPAKTAKPAATLSKQQMRNLIDSFSYAAGVNIANNMKDQGITNINSNLLLKAIDDVFKNKPTSLTNEQCSIVLQQQMGIFGKAKEVENKKKVEEEKVKGTAFLENNKKRAGVIALPNGLQYEILEAGEPNGAKPAAVDTVVVDYVGTLIDGKQFDASVGRGPATFPLNGVIRGWTEILQLMPKGAHWKVYIPSDMAYGDRGAGADIPGGAVLIFEITLHEIKPATVK